jgi:hypothetical protein
MGIFFKSIIWCTVIEKNPELWISQNVLGACDVKYELQPGKKSGGGCSCK